MNSAIIDQFVEFVIDLSENRKDLEKFKKDPEGYLSRADISEELREFLIGGFGGEVAAATVVVVVVVVVVALTARTALDQKDVAGIVDAAVRRG